jgi:hypothetical protein
MDNKFHCFIAPVRIVILSSFFFHSHPHCSSSLPLNAKKPPNNTLTAPSPFTPALFVATAYSREQGDIAIILTMPTFEMDDFTPVPLTSEQIRSNTAPAHRSVRLLFGVSDSKFLLVFLIIASDQ